jgi:hypothetical protein
LRAKTIKLDIPSEPYASQRLDDWQWFGVLSDEPTWGALFDEIEFI